MKYYQYEFYGEVYNLGIVKHSYADNDTLALELVDVETGEPFSMLTVNLCDGVANNEYQYVDTNNNSNVERFIKSNKLGKFTGMYGHSGFCSYPLYKFDLKKLEG